jgi:hypothetical protein
MSSLLFGKKISSVSFGMLRLSGSASLNTDPKLFNQKAPSRPGMRFEVGGTEAIRCDLGVDLGGGYMLVS